MINGDAATSVRRPTFPADLYIIIFRRRRHCHAGPLCDIHVWSTVCMQNRAEHAIRSTDIAYNAVSQAKKTYQCYPDVVQLSTETAYELV